MAVVAAGAWGKNHIRVFSEIPGVRLKYICDQDAARLAPLQKTFPQSEKVETLAPVLKDPEIQGVVIASSAISHASLAKEALHADKDVLVEKPMALNPKDAAEMLEIARRRKRVLMVVHLLIYHPVVDRLKEMTPGGHGSWTRTRHFLLSLEDKHLAQSKAEGCYHHRCQAPIH